MSGQSGHNLNILSSRRGVPRFPFEQPGVGDGYAGAGPVVSYRLSPEEIAARYGPPAQVKDHNLTRAAVKFAVGKAESPAHAAQLLKISEARLLKEMARHCIAVPEKWEEVEEEMENQAEYTIGGAGAGETAGAVRKEDEIKKVGNEQTQAAQGLPEELYESVRNLDDSALPLVVPPRERLTREEYLRLKGEGLSDNAIRKQVGISNATFYALKKEWGLMGLRVDAPTATPAPAQKSLADLIPPEPAPAKKTLLDIARGKLTLDEYKNLKEQGKTDHDIAKQHGIDRDVLNRLKREWGVIGMYGKQSGQSTGGQETPAADIPRQAVTTGARMTIAEALQLRAELMEDIEDLTLFIDEPSALNSDRVTQMLTWHRDQCQLVLERIDAVFAGTEVRL